MHKIYRGVPQYIKDLRQEHHLNKIDATHDPQWQYGPNLGLVLEYIKEGLHIKSYIVQRWSGDMDTQIFNAVYSL